MARPAFSTFQQICDKIAVLSRQRPCTQDAGVTFANDTQLPSSYVMIKNYVDIASRMAVLRMNERFLRKEYYYTLVAGLNGPYDFFDEIGCEGIVYHSWFCYSTGAARQLFAWPSGDEDSYISYRKTYPDMTVIPTGPPSHWVLIPVETGQQNRHAFYIHPIPDQSYNLVYQAKLNPVALVNYNDVIQWPPEYEHALIMFAKALFDNELGVSDPSFVVQLAEQAVAAVKAWGSGPLEGRYRQRMAVRMRGARSGNRRFDFDGTAGW